MEQKSFEQLFVARNPNYAYLLTRMRAALGVDEVSFSDINATNLRAFKDYMTDEVSANSLRTYMSVLKAFINQLADDGLVNRINLKVACRVKSTPQQNIALTESDVRKLEAYYDRLYSQAGKQIEKDVLTLFLLEVYCGARGVDIERMTTDNISDGMLSYVSQKTKVLAVIPAHRRLALLLSRKPTRQYSRMTKNNIIKRACQRCGFIEPVTLFYHGKRVTKPRYEFAGFHTARRTFASILAAKGAPIAEISQFMSHSNTSMTERYIKVDTQHASTAAMSFFND